MIKKLRWKFTIISLASIAVLLTVIFTAVNVINFAKITKSSDEITYIIADSGGSFPDQVNEKGHDGALTGAAEIAPADPAQEITPYGGEMSNSVRYFSVAYHSDGSTVINTRHITAFDDASALALANTLRGKNVGWASKFHRYRAMTKDATEYVVVVDLERELTPSYNVLWTSVFGSLAGLVVSALVLIPVSKAFVKPLEESNKKQRQFISDASHELKTPLTIISANNEIEEITNGESEQTRTISKEVKVLTEMVKNLNSLARINEFGDKQDVVDINLSKICEEVGDGFGEAFQTANKKLYLQIEPDVHLKINEVMALRIISNIFSNASKYSATYASFSLRKEGKTIHIREENDTKNPVPDGPVNHIFERFYRTDEARGSGIEGSGIGLAIVKETVDLEKGRINAYGENHNFVIEIDLPAKR